VGEFSLLRLGEIKKLSLHIIQSHGIIMAFIKRQVCLENLVFAQAEAKVKLFDS
jgi:hypothetical protein